MEIHEADKERYSNSLFPQTRNCYGFCGAGFIKHVSKITDYKFNVRPEYFGDESSYVDVFPKRIKRILAEDADAKIFCVFDWDTVYCNAENMRKHRKMERNLKEYIDRKQVVLCPSMPSIEYWFLLHFENRTELMKTYGKVNNLLGPHLRLLLNKLYEKSELPPIGKFLKKEKFLENDRWVKALCEGGKLETAIKKCGAEYSQGGRVEYLGC